MALQVGETAACGYWNAGTRKQAHTGGRSEMGRRRRGQCVSSTVGRPPCPFFSARSPFFSACEAPRVKRSTRNTVPM